MCSNDYKLPLHAVRPDCAGVIREQRPDQLPAAPPMPYSRHTPPHFMQNDNKEKYLKLGTEYFALKWVGVCVGGCLFEHESKETSCRCVQCVILFIFASCVFSQSLHKHVLCETYESDYIKSRPNVHS